MKRLHSARCVQLALALSVVVAAAAVSRAQSSVMGDWTPEMTWGGGGGIEAIHVHMLPTGKVMFWSTWRESAGLWDPATGLFSTPAQPTHNVFCAGHVFLPDGRLMAVGGHISNYNGENRSDIYNPWTNTWSNTSADVPDVPVMGTTSTSTSTSGKRWYPSATTLGNGDVLVLSGDVTQQGVTNRRTQIYRLATNTWDELTNALRPTDDRLPEYPRVFLAPDGRAISMSDNSNDTEWLNLSGEGSWTYLSDTLDPNLHNYGPAVMYDTGKIAYIGGGHTPTKNISMLDLNVANPAWRYAGGGTTPPPANSPYVMTQPRRHNNATILADGTVLITGGTYVEGWNDPNGLVAAAEIWDPVTEQVTQLAEANVGIYRGYHSTATLLPDGRVLVTGGDHDYGGLIPGQNRNAEIFSPPYLFKGPRPTVTSAPDVVELGDTVFVQTPDAEDIAKALWVVPGSTTHAQNWTQRANTLDFTVTDGGVNIELPADMNEAPIGYYMLFLVNSAGVPSIAEWVRATLPVVSPLNADFNGDGIVDGADLLVWQRNEGGPVGAQHADGDADGDGIVDASDLAVWQDQFGEEVTPNIASVPEPTSAILSSVTLLAAALRRRR